jgi:beta-1,4-N-acetylglucosaminyltransferase
MLLAAALPIILSYLPFEVLLLLLATATLIILLFLFRIYRKSKNPPAKSKNFEKVKTCFVLGSGGHTTELLRIVKTMGPQYSPRVYILADTDKMSETRVRETEGEKGGVVNEDYALFRIPRSREVRQSYLSSFFTTLNSIAASIPIMFSIRPDVIICNGPGTCVPICILGALLDMFLIKKNLIVFVESIARVKALSLSGELLYRFRIADKILVQWQEQKDLYPRVEMIGRL